MITALIIGYGSIGKRHANILEKFPNVSNIVILTSQNIKKYETISSLKQIKKINPNYIVIASPTSMHYRHLKYCVENFSNKTILVEKPLYNNYKNLNIKKNKVYIGFNLRFHPVIQKLRKEINNKKIFNLYIQNSSYLPDWRVGRNYINTSSAKRTSGGGVRLDISHELDFIYYLFGNYRINYAYNSTISDLKIDTDDILIMKGEIKKRLNKKISILLNLNFFSKIKKRLIFIDGPNISIYADLIKSKITIFKGKNKKIITFGKKNVDINQQTYIDLHKAVFQNDKILCSYKDGITQMKNIDMIRKISSL